MAKMMNARYGSFASVWPGHGDFPFTPVNGRSQDRRACLKGATNGLMHRNKFEEIHWRKSDRQCDRTSVVRNWLSGVQLIEQRAGLLRIERVETLGEPAVDRRQQFARLLHLALVAPEPRHAHRRAQFPGFCLLLTGDGERTLKIHLRFRHLRHRGLQCNFASHAINFGLAPFFLGCFHR